MEGHVLAGPRAQAPAEMGSNSVNRLECGQGCLLVPLVFLSALPQLPNKGAVWLARSPGLLSLRAGQREAG